MGCAPCAKAWAGVGQAGAQIDFYANLPQAAKDALLASSMVKDKATQVSAAISATLKFTQQGYFSSPDQAVAALTGGLAATGQPLAAAVVAVGWAFDKTVADVLIGLFGEASGGAGLDTYCGQFRIDLTKGVAPPLDPSDQGCPGDSRCAPGETRAAWIHGPFFDMGFAWPPDFAITNNGLDNWVTWEMANRSESGRGTFRNYFYNLLSQAFELYRNCKLPGVDQGAILQAAAAIWNQTHDASTTEVLSGAGARASYVAQTPSQGFPCGGWMPNCNPYITYADFIMGADPQYTVLMDPQAVLMPDIVINTGPAIDPRQQQQVQQALSAIFSPQALQAFAQDLKTRCQNGDKDACDQLKAACEAGNQPACNAFRDLLGAAIAEQQAAQQQQAAQATGLSTPAKVAVGTAAVAGAAVVGIGIWAWLTHQAVGVAFGKAWDATGGRLLAAVEEPLRRNPVLGLLPSAMMLAAGERASMQVQSLLFPRPEFTPSRAKRWARTHGYKYGKTDVTSSYVRVRQAPPSRFKIMRTIPFGDSGIRAVVGR